MSEMMELLTGNKCAGGPITSGFQLCTDLCSSSSVISHLRTSFSLLLLTNKKSASLSLMCCEVNLFYVVHLWFGFVFNLALSKIFPCVSSPLFLS